MVGFSLMEIMSLHHIAVRHDEFEQGQQFQTVAGARVVRLKRIGSRHHPIVGVGDAQAARARALAVDDARLRALHPRRVQRPPDVEAHGEAMGHGKHDDVP